MALSIPLCGADVAKRLLHTADSVQELFDRAANAPSDDIFSDVEGLGAMRSAAFVKWCKDPSNQALVADLLGQVTLTMPATAPTTGACAGLTFVITGDVHHYANRNAFKAYVESAGGKVAGSVSGATNFLVNNDAASTSSKNRKARELGIPVITEDEFVARFGPEAKGE